MKRDDVLHKFGDVILKFAGQTPTASTFAESSGGGGNTLNLSDDFIKLDTDFQAASFEAIKLGVDTLKLHVSGEGANDSFIKWAGDLSDVVEPRGIGANASSEAARIVRVRPNASARRRRECSGR